MPVSREHLRETEENAAHVTAVLESLDTGVIVADSQDVVVRRCNHSTEQLLGVPQAQLQGPASAVLAEIAKTMESTRSVLSGVTIALSTNRPHRRIREPGSENWVLIHDVTRIRQL